MIEVAFFAALVVHFPAALTYPGPLVGDDGVDLVKLADRYCIQPDGDHRLTWTLAERDGFAPMSPDSFRNLHLPAANGLRGFQKAFGQIEVRVLTAAHRKHVPDDGTTHFRTCWVSASPSDRNPINRGLRALLGVPYFRAEQTFVYAWIPRPDGYHETVSRRIYMRDGNTLAREQGMRQVTLRAYQGGVFIGYASPRDEATYREFDWAGPEPVPAPR